MLGKITYYCGVNTVSDKQETTSQNQISIINHEKNKIHENVIGGGDTKPVLDLNILLPLNKNNVQKNLRLLKSMYGTKFDILFKDKKVPVVLKKKFDSIWKCSFFELRYDTEKYYSHDLLPFSIIFIDIFSQKKENNTFIANIHKTDQLSGSAMVELVLQIQRYLGVRKTWLGDGANVKCMNKSDMNLSFMKLLEKGETFYMRFGFKMDLDNAYAFAKFSSEKDLRASLRVLLKDIRKITIKSIIDLHLKIIEILTEVITKRDWDQFKIANYSTQVTTEPELLYYTNDAYVDIPKIFQHAYDIIYLLNKSKHTKLIDYLIESFKDQTQCENFIQLYSNVIHPKEPYYQISYKKKQVTLDYLKKFDYLLLIRNSFWYYYTF